MLPPPNSLEWGNSFYSSNAVFSRNFAMPCKCHHCCSCSSRAAGVQSTCQHAITVGDGRSMPSCANPEFNFATDKRQDDHGCPRYRNVNNSNTDINTDINIVYKKQPPPIRFNRLRNRAIENRESLAMPPQHSRRKFGLLLAEAVVWQDDNTNPVSWDEKFKALIE
jgi:hypothetical protein